MLLVSHVNERCQNIVDFITDNNLVASMADGPMMFDYRWGEFNE